MTAPRGSRIKPRRKGRRAALVAGIGVAACVALAVPRLAHRWVLFDAIEAGGPAEAGRVAVWEGSLWLRGRILRLASTQPSSLRAEVLALDQDGRRPPSAYTEDGGTRLEVDLDYAFNRGIWRYYLPRDWPECIRIVPCPAPELPESHQRNLNRYLDCHLAATIEVHEISRNTP